MAQLLRKISAKEGGDEGAEAVVLEGPGGVLAGGAAAEVGPRHEDASAAEDALVEDEGGVLAPVVEEELAEAAAFDPLEVLGGDDLVGIDVGAVEGQGLAADSFELSHQRISHSRISTK